MTYWKYIYWSHFYISQNSYFLCFWKSFLFVNKKKCINIHKNIKFTHFVRYQEIEKFPIFLFEKKNHSEIENLTPNFYYLSITKMSVWGSNWLSRLEIQFKPPHLHRFLELFLGFIKKWKTLINHVLHLRYWKYLPGCFRNCLLWIK